MSNAIYPTFPGLSFGAQRAVIAPPVTIRTTPSQREYRARDATLPRYAYTLDYEFLRSSAVFPELQALAGFFNARGGRFDSFLFNDTDDNAAVAQLFGAGNAALVAFQLMRSFGGFAEQVNDLNGAPSIYVNGALQASGYTVSATGLVTFTTAPASGAVLTWTGAFYRRVRFNGEQLDTAKFMRDLWEAKRVNLLSLKPGEL